MLLRNSQMTYLLSAIKLNSVQCNYVKINILYLTFVSKLKMFVFFFLIYLPYFINELYNIQLLFISIFYADAQACIGSRKLHLK